MGGVTEGISDGFIGSINRNSKGMRHIKQLALIAVIVMLLGASVWRKQQQITAQNPKACLIDALDSVQTRHNFTEKAAKLLKAHGYRTKIYTGDQVTVDLLKQLEGYDIIILRTHSGVFDGGVWLFTGEEFDSSKHVLDQLAGEVHLSKCPGDPRLLFAVGSRFFEHYIEDVDGGLVVLMGCDGLKEHDLASTFVGLGAVGVLGWDGGVSLDDSDYAVLCFLEAYLEGGGVEEVVSGFGSSEGGLLFFKNN